MTPATRRRPGRPVTVGATERTELRLPPDLIARIRRTAKRLRVSVSEIARRALDAMADP